MIAATVFSYDCCCYLFFFTVSMAGNIAFCAALQCFGFTHLAIISIDANGLTSTLDFIGIEAKDVENIMKIV
jgi:hypothetical protein